MVGKSPEKAWALPFPSCALGEVTPPLRAQLLRAQGAASCLVSDRSHVTRASIATLCQTLEV